MGRVKEMYMEMLERDLEFLTLEEYKQLKDLADQHAEEQFLKELKEKNDSEESV
jgi:hypothetical protein